MKQAAMKTFTRTALSSSYIHSTASCDKHSSEWRVFTDERVNLFRAAHLSIQLITGTDEQWTLISHSTAERKNTKSQKHKKGT